MSVHPGYEVWIIIQDREKWQYTTYAELFELYASSLDQIVEEPQPLQKRGDWAPPISAAARSSKIITADDSSIFLGLYVEARTHVQHVQERES